MAGKELGLWKGGKGCAGASMETKGGDSDWLCLHRLRKVTSTCVTGAKTVNGPLKNTSGTWLSAVETGSIRSYRSGPQYLTTKYVSEMSRSVSEDEGQVVAF